MSILTKFDREVYTWSMRLAGDPGVLAYELIGTCSIEGCDPKDVDFLVLMPPVPGNIVTTHRWHFGADFTLPAGEYEETADGHWCAIRRGNVNIIMTTNPEWYSLALLANKVAVGLRLTDKKDRITAFRIIRDGMDPEVARVFK